MKLTKAIITLLLILLVAFNIPLYADSIEPAMGPQQTPKMMDDGRGNPDQPVSSQAPDYINSLDAIQNYIDENIRDTFAGLHIERDDNGREKVVLSFTQELSQAQKEAVLALADQPELLVFRLVKFSKGQLDAKQQEINLAWESLKAEGIMIHQSGVNVITNKVEVGIEPFNPETIAKVKERFGSEMIEVVQGYEVKLLTRADGAEPGPAVADIAQAEIAQEDNVQEAAPEKLGFFQRIAAFFKSLFQRLISSLAIS